MVDNIICVSCNDVMASDDEFLEFDGNSFCSYACANNKGYIECMSCDEYFQEDSGHSFELDGTDHSYCSDDCLKDNGFNICYSCDNPLNESGRNTVESTDGNFFCDSDCANNSDYYKCDRCGDVFEEATGELITVDGEDAVFCSSDCRIEDDIEYCSNCNSYFNRNNDGLFIDDEMYCSADCAGAEQCRNCNEYQLKNNGIETQESYFYCDWDCAERHDVCACNNCNEFYDASENGVVVNDSDYFCSEDCADSSECYGCEKHFYNSDLFNFDGEVYCSVECSDAIGCCHSDCEEWVLESDAVVVNNTHGVFSYCSRKCAKDDGFLCNSCDKEIDFDGYYVDFTDDSGNDLVFCDGLCAKEKEILECDVCESYETYTKSYTVDDKIYCSEKCLYKRDYIKCYRCSNFVKKVDKNNLCIQCVSQNTANINKKELYNEKYNLENLDLKIGISNNIYRKNLDRDKTKNIQEKFSHLKSIGFYEKVGLIPYKQDTLGPFSYRYSINNSNNCMLINLCSVVLIRPENKEVIEVCDLTKEDSNRGLLNEFILHGNHLVLDVFNVLNDDRRSLKVFLEKFKK